MRLWPLVSLLLALPSAYAADASVVSLTGAGSTFSYPLYSKWFAVYHVAHKDIEVSYQSIGSSAGVKQITEKTVDFGASDVPLTDEEMAKAPGILHIPTELGAVALTFNLAGVTSLNLSNDNVAAIFLGDISRWDDHRLAADNKDVKLPKLPITVIHRTDGSGTTYVFTDYLYSVSSTWKTRVGQAGRTVVWPVGMGAKGNEGAATQALRQNGSIAYVELAYARQNKMGVARLKNRDGQWVSPTPGSVQEAAAALADKMPADLRTSIVNAPGKQSYPISSFSYSLIYKEQADLARGKALVEFLWWAVHDGQDSNESLSYARLPPEVVKHLETKLREVQHEGKSLLSGT